jgi:hypothetical protein
MTACQICERPIKATTGLIAHHGYQRPHQMHFQTRSCFGARYRPYEVASDALSPYIEMLVDWEVRTRKHLLSLRSDPPATLTFRWSNSWRDREGSIEIPRPEGFDPATARPNYTPRAYVTLYLAAAYNDESEIKSLVTEIARCQARLAAWRPVEEAA